MNVALITRSTSYTTPGGDMVQVQQTARQLSMLGVYVRIHLSNERIAYEDYDLLHFFNIIRPADILYHYKKAKKPFVVSTILCSYSEYDKYHRKGIGALFSFLPSDSIEYVKTIGRWILGKDHLASMDYLWKGQRKGINEILRKTNMILPNSESEYQRVVKNYPCEVKHRVVPNGIDPEQFHFDEAVKKEDNLVICVARIEGRKNHLNLIKALNNTRFRLLIIGTHAPNQSAYYNECRKIAAPNVEFLNRIPLNELVTWYQLAKVHILPSWFETTGLSSLEAAVMGCNIVITDRGDTREYFGDNAFYCEPSSPISILNAVEAAAKAPLNQCFRNKILEQYTWKQAALQTLKAYQLAAIV